MIRMLLPTNKFVKFWSFFSENEKILMFVFFVYEGNKYNQISEVIIPSVNITPGYAQ